MDGDPRSADLGYAGDELPPALLHVARALLSAPELPAASTWIAGFSMAPLDVGPLRGTYRIERSDPPTVLKVFRPRGKLERLRALLRPNRAAQEWRMLRRAEQAGLPVPHAHGHAWIRGGDRRAAALLMSDLGPGTTLSELAAPREQQARALDPALCRRAGQLIARSRAAGLRHDDLHLGNLLLGTDGQLWLIDLHRARFVAASSPGQAAERSQPRGFSPSELAPLYLSLPWPQDQARRQALFGELGVAATPLGFAQQLERHLHKRLARCHRSSGVFVVDAKLRRRRGPLAERSAEDWWRIFAEATELKSGRRGRVLESVEHFAKERDLRHARALWEAAFALELREIPAPRAIALVPAPLPAPVAAPVAADRALVISERLSGMQPLDRCWANADFDHHAAARSLAASYARLHATGWRFRDGRGDNFVASPDGAVALVDLDGARPIRSRLRHSREQAAAKDLGRLLAWLLHQASPEHIRPAEHVRYTLRFARAYLRERRAHGRPVRNARKLLSEIVEHAIRWHNGHETERDR
jgi:tRNA A-37 threonylcarbamoyl transferase component Bud32